MQGATYGVFALDDVNFYDGVIKGKTAAINDELKVIDTETNYGIDHSSQTIGNDTYDVATLALGILVTFDGNGGTPSEPSKGVVAGHAIGSLPTAIYVDHELNGWWTDPVNGTQVTSSYIVNSPITLYAHWTYSPQIKYARIDSTEYASLEDAWTIAMASNTTKTIEILRDCSVTQALQVSSSKSVILDLSGYQVENTSGTVIEVANSGSFELRDTASGGKLIGGAVISGTQNTVIKNNTGGSVTISSGTVTSNVSQVIDNSGTMNITGGTISIGNYSQGVINNNAGATINMSGGTISATIAGSRRQAIYNKGTVNISGSAVLTSASSDRATLQNDASGAKITITGGTINSTNKNCTRGAIQNASGSVTITGGTVTSVSTKTDAGAIQNAGTLVIGVKDGSINASSPVLQGANYGVNNTGTYKFYDGILKGIVGAYSNTPNEIETNSQIISGTETIGNSTYQTAYLN